MRDLPHSTGKSFIGFRYAAEHPDERSLWLAPSECIFRTQMENWGSAGGEEPSNITFLAYAKVDANSHIYSADPQTSKVFAAFKADESEHLNALLKSCEGSINRVDRRTRSAEVFVDFHGENARM